MLLKRMFQFTCCELQHPSRLALSYCSKHAEVDIILDQCGKLELNVAKEHTCMPRRLSGVINAYCMLRAWSWVIGFAPTSITKSRTPKL